MGHPECVGVSGEKQIPFGNDKQKNADSISFPLDFAQGQDDNVLRGIFAVKVARS
jgi:hypothetical protein